MSVMLIMLLSGSTCQMFPSVTLILSAGWKGLKISASVSIIAKPVVDSIQEPLHSRALISKNVVQLSVTFHQRGRAD